MDKLGINPILILAQVVNFLIILFLLKKFLYGPIVKVLDERKKKAEDTERLNVEANTKLTEIDTEKKRVLAEAKKEAEKMVAESKLEMQHEKDAIMQKAQKEIQQTRAKLETEMKAEKEKMIKEVRTEITEMSILVTKKVLQESLDEKKQKDLIASALKEIENSATLN